MPVDPDIAEWLLGPQSAAPPAEEMPVREFRSAMEGVSALCAPPPEIASVHDGEIETADASVGFRHYHPDPGTTLPLVVYFHGGGWTTGGVDFMDPPLRALAAEANMAVMNVGYRLAPEHPFPAALDDARAATDWALSHAEELGGDPERVAVAGDSAGAALATTVARHARDDEPGPAHQLLINPAVDPRMDSGSYRAFATGYQNTAAVMERCWRTYLDRPAGRLDDAPADAAPAFAADLTGLPPATVLTVEYDPLRDEGEVYAARLVVAGVPTRLVRCPGLVNCALHLDGIAPAAAALREHAATALADALTPG